MLVLESSDADADAHAFRTANIAVSDALRIKREDARPDGPTVTRNMSFAFARDAHARGIGFAVCQPHDQDSGRNDAPCHPNSVTGIAGVVIVAENPTDLHIFLSAFTGERELQATSSGITAVTPRGDIRVMDPAAFHSHFGVPAPDIGTGARLAALRFAGGDTAALHAALRTGQVEFTERLGAVVVGPATALGATLVFEAAACAGR
jgi:hypothetical protein